MLYISIDIETGGLDEKNHCILEFGAILEDTNNPLPFETIPKFVTLLERPDENYVGSPYALAMHKEIFEELAKKPEDRTMTTIDYSELPARFYKWLTKVNPQLEKDSEEMALSPIEIIVAGKNFGHFDEQFIKNYIPHFTEYVKFNHRMLDPAVLYFDPKTDLKLPDLATCKKRAGMKNETISHRTLRDAMDVIEVIRYKLYPNPVLT